jgi:hypothetical protein
MTAKHKKCKKMQKNAKENTKIPICYQCIDCNFITNNKNNYNKHLGTIKHSEKCKKEKTSIEEINETVMNVTITTPDKKIAESRKKSQKVAKKMKKMKKNEKELIIYECIDCCIITNNKYDYNKHLGTKKHLDKYKKERASTEHVNKSEINENLFEKLIKTLIEQNKESQEKLYEQNKESQEKLIEILKDGKIINNTINNNNNTINNNATFNLNFFLNETCKDAISIEECINSIEVTDDKFYLLGEKKSIRGLSKIINYTIDKLSEIKRPVHCLDQKRDEYAIKLNNGWTRDETEYTPVVNRSISNLQYKYMNYGIQNIQNKVQDSDSKTIKYTKCMIELTEKVQIKDLLKTAFNEKTINKKNYLNP